VVVVLIARADSWGPLSHYYFAMQSLSQYDNASFKQGCDMPDSFYFANFTPTPTCSVPLQAMHNPITAGYFVQYAQQESRRLNHRSEGDVDPLSLALGFGSHMIADLVGFHQNGGYLGSTVQGWVTFFPFMSAVDAFLYATDSFSQSELDLPWASDAAADFVSAASEYYRTHFKSDFPVVTREAVLDCIMPWQETQDQLVNIAQKIQGPTNPQYYRSALVFWDQFNATSFGQASSHFQLSDSCIISAVTFWTDQILNNNPQLTPEAVFSRTVDFVNRLFAQGKCTPPAL